MAGETFGKSSVIHQPKIKTIEKLLVTFLLNIFICQTISPQALIGVNLLNLSSPNFIAIQYLRIIVVYTLLPIQHNYEEADFSYLIANSSAMYEAAAVQYELPSSSYELPSISPYELAESLETEQQIYETPYEDEENYGPIYSVPSSDEQKIYEEFERKRFRKLYHRELRYVLVINV